MAILAHSQVVVPFLDSILSGGSLPRMTKAGFGEMLSFIASFRIRQNFIPDMYVVDCGVSEVSSE